MKVKINENFHFYLKLLVVYLLIQIVVRSVLISKNVPGFIDFIDVYLDGLVWDSFAWVIISLPISLISFLLPKRFFQTFNQSHAETLCIFLFSVVFIFIGICEVLFWSEFRSRFNFIAVDYLIYTNEVLRNLQESYPMGLILSGVMLSATGLVFAIQEWQIAPTSRTFLNKRTGLTVNGLFLPLLFVNMIGPWMENHDEDFRDDQLSRNGVIEFIRAFRSNRIDYQTFYPVLPKEHVNDFFRSTKVPLMPINYGLQDKKPNVVMIVVESLGAKFIAPLKGQKDTTPYLNKLSSESIFFENLYATGTRTVRGLEAINLSVPPTPGYAVVKRPDHKNLYSLGNTFASNGYEPIFMYGGNGYFDNMNSFFKGNGFKVIDQSRFKQDEVTFSNAWGVCDEDLFHKAEKQLDTRLSQAKPFLLFLLTTSNHRPFTYPEGKIDIRSGESRAGAVKYTDYAIGHFLENAKKSSWGHNTIFVIVADHSTEGRGQFDLEMSDFHIPMWIYSQDLIKPQKISKLSSQIDILPSLIHLLGLNDDSPFYGQSIFNDSWKEERAFVGNYQYVGYYKNNVLTTLGPNRIIRNFQYNPLTKKQKSVIESPYVTEAISYYQSASHKLDSGEYKVTSKNAH